MEVGTSAERVRRHRVANSQLSSQLAGNGESEYIEGGKSVVEGAEQRSPLADYGVDAW